MLWLKKGGVQALAFIEPHGMVIWDPVKVELLKDIRALGLSVPTLAFIVTKTPPRSIGAIGGKSVTEEWLRRHHILFQGNGTYVEEILLDLRQAVEAVVAGQYEEGDVVTAVRQTDVAILDDGDVLEDMRFKNYLPVYSLKAAAGYFGAGEAVECEGWVQVDGRLSKDMFTARAVGQSMEPIIQDGDLCVFRTYRGGTRQNRTVLVQWSGPDDPETGGSYAVKRYNRIGERGSDEFHIELRPHNPDFEPIVLTPEFEDEVAVIAEFIQVLQPPIR